MKLEGEVSKSKYRIQALDRALNLLECFSYQNRELNLSQLSRLTGLNKTTTKRILANLTSRGYLQQDPSTKRYQLGLRLFELGGIVYSSFSLRKSAAPHMLQLRDSTGLTVLLGIRQDDQLLYADKLEGTGIVRISSDIGWRRSISFGMLGMVLLAYLPSERVRELLDRSPLEAYTPYSITDPDAFSLRLAQIHEQGYIVEKEEAHIGIMGIAAPVRDYSRQVVASVGVAAPIRSREQDPSENDIIKLVKTTAECISADLGYLKI